MIRHLTLTAALALGAASVAGGASAGAPLPAASSSASCNDNVGDGTVSGASFCTLLGASATVSPFPWVALEATINNAPGVATQDAFANLTYYFEVTGGVDGTLVPIDITLNLASRATGSATAFGFASFSSGPLSENVCSGDVGCTQSAFSGTLTFSVLAGQAIAVNLGAGAEVSYALGGFAWGSADPLIFIDPGFADAGQYRVVLSEGVANALPPGGVPEPTSWALMICGFGLTGAALRRRRGALAALPQL